MRCLFDDDAVVGVVMMGMVMMTTVMIFSIVSTRVSWKGVTR